MYLSCLEIDISDSRGRTWLANPYRIHQRLLMAFPDGEAGRLLFRIEPEGRQPRVIAQSPTEPDWDRAFADHPVLVSPPRVKRLELHLEQGQQLRFLLHANPTRRSVRHTTPAPDGGRPVGKRVGIVREDEQRAWLDRKGEAGGFQPLMVEIRPQGKTAFQRGQSRPGQQTHVAAQFEGRLRVLEPRAFLEILEQGIGSAKAFGFGLLSIAPAG